MNSEVAYDEVVNTLLFFKNHSMEEEINESSRMEKEKMGHNTNGIEGFHISISP